MFLRSIMLSLALCAIVAARVVCPCASGDVASPAQAKTEAKHTCCGSSETPKEESPKPCKKSGQSCVHCNAQLAPSDKAIDLSQLAVAPVLIHTIVEPVISLDRTTIHPEPRLLDPSPPSLLSLHCVLVI